MSSGYIATAEIEINSPVSKVWNAIVTPYKAKLKIIDEQIEPWQVGSALSFVGAWEQEEYEDKGVITQLKEEQIFEYAFWTKFSRKLDIPENYDVISFEFEKAKKQQTILKITQNNYKSQEAAEKGRLEWSQTLVAIKQMLER